MAAVEDLPVKERDVTKAESPDGVELFPPIRHRFSAQALTILGERHPGK